MSNNVLSINPALSQALNSQPVDFEKHLEQHEKNSHIQRLKHVSSFMDAAMQRLEHGVQLFGDPMPWTKTQDKFRFRPSEVTLWVGPNGQGKSLVMGQCAIPLSKNKKVGIASFEMPADATVARMYRQASGGGSPTRDIINRINNELQIYIYDHVGNLNTNTVYGMVHYMAEQGVEHVMIDSLVKCGVNSEKNEPQKDFLNKLQAIAKEHKIHIHLVHHVRKGANDTDTPDKNSIKGAGELADLADNILMITRNQKKAKAIREKLPFDEDAPDSFIDVLKQRHGEWEGRFCFWWCEKTMQWIDNKQGEYHRYVR